MTSVAQQRPQWRSHTEFLLTMVGYAVGLGNVWRFPYLCFENGGAVFLIPYMLILIFLGIPLFCLELGSGQFFNKNNIYVWPTFCRYMGGVGLTSLAATFIVCIYYNVILSWALLYLGASFISPLPWKEEYNSRGNLTMDSTIYFQEDVLHLSDNIGDFDMSESVIPWKLALCFTVAWIIIYLIIFKGIKSAGRVVYFTSTFPYLVLTIMVVRAVTLEGASEGLRFYLVPDFSKLATLSVWIKAAEQIFFSLSVSYGTHTTFASYNPKDHNFFSDVYMIPFINAFTSFYAGFAVFGTLGYLSHKYDLPVPDVAAGGFGLAFEVYPSALALMVAPNFFSFLFFFMLVLLAVGSQFAFAETVVSAIVEADIHLNFSSNKQITTTPGEATSNSLENGETKSNEGLDQQKELELKKTLSRRKKVATVVVCVTCWLLGFVCISKNGLYFVQVLDDRAIGFSLFAVASCELFSLYYYGVDKFVKNCQDMVGVKISKKYDFSLRFFSFCWKYISPIVCLLLLIGGIYNMYSDLNEYDIVCKNVRDETCSAKNVQWGINMGSILCLLCFSLIPFGIVYEVWRSKRVEKNKQNKETATNETASKGLQTANTPTVSTPVAASESIPKQKGEIELN